jgi:type IV pilus assembly protein PilZ
MRKARRIHERIPMNVLVDYEDFERFHPDRLLNLSAGGAFILTPRPLPVNRQLTFRISLPELPGIRLKVHGSVVWSPISSRDRTAARHPMGMGVEFDATDRDLLRLLDQYVTVNSGLRNLDTRIGRELPPHLWAELPKPNGDLIDISPALE